MNHKANSESILSQKVDFSNISEKNHQVRICVPFDGGAWSVEVDREGAGCISCMSFDSLTEATLAALTAADYYGCRVAERGAEVLR